MPSFPLLDVAIGLAFIYLLLSLVCSSVNEGLESFLRNRATDLEAGIRKLLGDKAGSWWASFLPWVNSVGEASITSEFYRHPLIRGLFQTETRLPTYVPARSFALAVMDMVTKDGELLRGATQHSTPPAPGKLAFADTVNGVTLPESLRKSIDALVTAADGDTQQARLNIETWFNSSMDSVSGWYKSRTQKILFCIGLIVTVAVNADSIAMFRNLSVSKNLQAIVGAAEKTAGEKLPSGKDPRTQIDNAMGQLMGLNVGLGWASESAQKGDLDRTNLPPSFDKTSCKVETGPCTDPVGWTFHLLYLHLMGWMITAAALSLGAPFWFDTLNRIIVVRSTVKPKEKSQDEGSKDRGSQA